MKLKIKKGDSVEVIAGADRGKRGAVLEIKKNPLKLRVQGVRMQTHFEKDGRSQKEGLIDYSNVKLVAAKAEAGSKAKAKSTKKSAARASAE